MTEDTLNENSKLNQIISSFKKRAKLYISIILLILVSLFLMFFIQEKDIRNDVKVSNKYNKALVLLKNKKLDESKIILDEIVKKKHRFYSPMSLYLIIDNDLEKDKSKILISFNKIVNSKKIDQEQQNLIKIKKALFMFENNIQEDEIIKTLKPIINSDSKWRNRAIELIGDYYSHKGENLKADEYYKLLNVQDN